MVCANGLCRSNTFQTDQTTALHSQGTNTVYLGPFLYFSAEWNLPAGAGPQTGIYAVRCTVPFAFKVP